MKTRLIRIGILCLILLFGTVHAETSEMKIGYWDEQTDLVRDFRILHPELEITCGSMNMRTTDDLVSAFLTGEFDYDVFPLFSIQYNLHPLMEKGYLADLSGFRKIRDLVLQMRSDVTSLCMFENRIYALPYCLELNYLARNPDAWEAAGLTDDDVPSTFPAFLSLLEKLANNGYPGFCINGMFDENLYNENRYTEWLLKMLFDNDMMQKNYGGQELSFRDPGLLSLMEKCKTVGRALYQQEPIANQGRALFTSEESSVSESSSIVFLRLQEDQPRLMKGYLDFVAIREGCMNKEAAAEFAMSIMDSIVEREDEQSVFLFQKPRPILRDETAWEIEEIEKRMDSLRLEMEQQNQEGEAKVVQQEEWNSLELRLQECQRPENLYAVSQEQVNGFLESLDGLYIETPGPLSIGSENGQLLSQWIDSFAAGLISGEQMLQRMDEISWMMTMEDN